MSTPYQSERDDLQPSLRKDSAGVISWWPKDGGVNVALSADPTFTVHTPAGTQVQSGTASRTSVGGVTRVDCAISALATLDCDYQLRISYTPPGAPSAKLHVIPFDVVLWPLEVDVSLNDLLPLRPDLGRILDVLRANLSPAPTQAEMAGRYIYDAVLELDARLRAQVRADGTGVSRTNVILNRGGLSRWVRYAAARNIYAAAGGTAQGEQDKDRAFQHFVTEASLAWKGLGPLRPDTSGDLVVDGEDRNRGRSVRVRRAW